MRSMTQTDAAMLLELHKNKHRVPGMIGCLDCMHVPWENCLNSLCGQHVGKEGVPTLVVEASCDYNLFFGIMMLGMQGHLTI